MRLRKQAILNCTACHDYFKNRSGSFADFPNIIYHKLHLKKKIQEILLIPNYSERWRYNETIASSFVESTVNEVITKRMVKKQQMQWSYIGAHYVLQTRTATLNGDLPRLFERWYPGLKIENENHVELEHWQKAA